MRISSELKKSYEQDCLVFLPSGRTEAVISGWHEASSGTSPGQWMGNM